MTSVDRFIFLVLARFVSLVDVLMSTAFWGFSFASQQRITFEDQHAPTHSEASECYIKAGWLV